MAHCQNENCKKDGLRKEDVEFCDVSKLILCHGCYALMHPGWKPPFEIVDLTDKRPSPKIGYALQISNEEGIKAKVSYGDISLSVHIPASELNGIVKS